MYAIQNGPNWWIDSVARFPVGEVESRGRIGAMSNTTIRNPFDIDEVDHSSDAMNSVISNIEEEGEAGNFQEIQANTIDGIQNDSQSFNQSIANDMQLNPAAGFAATNPSPDRMGLFALLKA